MTQILIINQSSLVTDAQISQWIPALQTQITRDFAPVWGVDGTLTFTDDGDASRYRVILKDAPDNPNDLGYHEVNGIPEARIFCQPTIADGDSVSSVLSHELLEMLADPLANRMAPDGIHIVEVCDPVETTFYEINGVLVSNFVFPNYFGFPSGGSWDHNGQLSGPCPTLLPGGYQMSLVNGQWQTHFAHLADGCLSNHARRPSGRRTFRASQPILPAL